MKTIYLKWSIIVIVILISFSSCKKDSDTPVEDTTTPTELLTAGNWLTTAITINPGVDIGNGVILTDLFSQLDACEKDDLLIFNTNGTVTADEGAVKCDANDPQSVNDGTWTISSDYQTLTLTPPAENSEDPVLIASILTLTDNQLVISFEMAGFGLEKNASAAYTYTISMKRQ